MKKIKTEVNILRFMVLLLVIILCIITYDTTQNPIKPKKERYALSQKIINVPATTIDTSIRYYKKSQYQIVYGDEDPIGTFMEYIEREIPDSTTTFLETKITDNKIMEATIYYHDLLTIKKWRDPVKKENIDSLKCLRYNQAKRMVEDMNYMENINCEPKQLSR